MDIFFGFFVGSYPPQVGEFDLNPLEHSVKSGRRISRSLSLAFPEMKVQKFVNEQATPEALSQVPNRCDRLWFHFIGHGTSDAILLYDKDGALAAVTPQFLATQLQKVVASQIFVVIDCCFSGAFCEELRRILKERGMMDHFHILSSTSDDELAWEDERLRSTCFSVALGEALKDAKLNDPYFGIAEKFDQISKGTSASAFGFKRGAKQNPKLWRNEQAAKSLKFGHALTRRLATVLILVTAVSVFSLASAKLAVQRYGISPEGELIVQRGPKFLSVTENIFGLFNSEHTDVVARTGLLAGANFQDLSNITEQRLWWIRGRAGDDGIDVGLERLLSSLHAPYSDDLRARTLDQFSISESLAPQTAALRLMIRGPDLNSPPWPSLDEINSLVPPCGYFLAIPPAQELQRVSNRHSFFSQEALSRGSIETVNYLVALAKSESRAAFYFDGSNSRLLVGSSSQISHGLLNLVKRLGMKRGRAGLPVFLSATERDALLFRLKNSMPSEVLDYERAACFEYADFFAAILGQAEHQYEVKAWEDLFAEKAELQSLTELEDDEDDLSDLGSAVPAIDRLTALTLSGQLKGLGPIVAEIETAFSGYSSLNNSFNREQADLMADLTSIALNGELPKVMLDELMYALDHLDEGVQFNTYINQPHFDELELIWALSLQAPYLNSSDYSILANKISNYESALNEFYDISQGQVPADQLLASRQTSSDALLLIWANMSRGGEVPDHWFSRLMGQDLQDASSDFGQKSFENDWVPNVWSSTHSSIMATAIFGTANDIDPSAVSILKDFLVHFEQGKIPPRQNSGPLPSSGAAFVNDPSMRYASICYAVGRSEFSGISKAAVVDKIEQKIVDSLHPSSTKFSMCPLSSWIAAQSHLDQREYIGIFRDLWASQDEWMVRNQISNLIIATIPLDFSDKVFFD